MKRILLVDDSKTTVRMISRIVKEILPQVVIWAAHSGEEAVDIVKGLDEPIDLALIDYNMPGMNGLECAEQVSALQPDAGVVLCTANVQSALEKRAKEQGVDFIGKPLTREKIESFL